MDRTKHQPKCSDFGHDICGTLGGAGIFGILTANVCVYALEPVSIPATRAKLIP